MVVVPVLCGPTWSITSCFIVVRTGFTNLKYGVSEASFDDDSEFDSSCVAMRELDDDGLEVDSIRFWIVVVSEGECEGLESEFDSCMVMRGEVAKSSVHWK